MPNNDIVYLLKFAPKEAFIEDLLNGRLYMNAAGYYQGLPGERGDPLEASIMRIGIFTVLSTLLFSRTVYMQ